MVAGEFLVNLRAEGAPEILEAVVARHLDKARAAVRVCVAGEFFDESLGKVKCYF